jgi:hypothetical protein
MTQHFNESKDKVSIRNIDGVSLSGKAEIDKINASIPDYKKKLELHGGYPTIFIIKNNTVTYYEKSARDLKSLIAMVNKAINGNVNDSENNLSPKLAPSSNLSNKASITNGGTAMRMRRTKRRNNRKSRRRSKYSKK